MNRKDLVLVGQVSGAFGLKGELKLFSYCRGIETFERAKYIYIGPNPEHARLLTITSLRKHDKKILLSVNEIANRNQATTFVSFWVYLNKDSLLPLLEGEYYWYQLKDALVVNDQGIELGRVIKIANVGSYDLLLVKSSDGKEAFIPVVEDIIVTIKISENQIIANFPLGFFEAQGWLEENSTIK